VVEAVKAAAEAANQRVVDVMLADGGRDDKIRAQAQAPAHARTRGEACKCAAYIVDIRKQTQSNKTFLFGTAAAQPSSLSPRLLSCSFAVLFLSCFRAQLTNSFTRRCELRAGVSNVAESSSFSSSSY